MMPRKKRARSERDKELQFKQILKMGERILQEKQGKGFSLRELARRLKMAPSNLYNYVKNENELRVAILHAHLRTSIDDLDQLTETRGMTYLQMLRTIISHYFESSQNEHSWVVLELMNLQPSDNTSMDLELLINPYRNIIEKAITASELPKQDVELSALYVWSLLQGTANMLRLAKSNKIFDESRKVEYKEYITNLIISSLKSI